MVVTCYLFNTYILNRRRVRHVSVSNTHLITSIFLNYCLCLHVSVVLLGDCICVTPSIKRALKRVSVYKLMLFLVVFH